MTIAVNLFLRVFYFIRLPVGGSTIHSLETFNAGQLSSFLKLFSFNSIRSVYFILYSVFLTYYTNPFSLHFLLYQFICFSERL